jgi:hypothetical protein
LLPHQLLLDAEKGCSSYPFDLPAEKRPNQWLALSVEKADKKWRNQFGTKSAVNRLTEKQDKRREVV